MLCNFMVIGQFGLENIFFSGKTKPRLKEQRPWGKSLKMGELASWIQKLRIAYNLYVTKMYD